MLEDQTLFNDTSESEDTTLFEGTASTFSPENVPEDFAYNRGLVLSMLGPPLEIPANVQPISESTSFNEKSPEEQAIINNMVSDMLSITDSVGIDMLSEVPSLDTLDFLAEYAAELATNNFNLKSELVKQLSDSADSPNEHKQARVQVEAWFNLNSEVQVMQKAFETKIEDTDVLKKTNAWLNVLIKAVAPGAHSLNVSELAKQVNPEGYAKVTDPTTLSHNFGVVPGQLLVGEMKDVILEGLVNAKPTEKAEIYRSLFELVNDNPNIVPYELLFNHMTKDGVNKKILMEELLYRVKEGNIEGIDWDRYLENFFGVLDLLPFAIPKVAKTAKVAARAERWVDNMMKLASPEEAKLLTHVKPDKIAGDVTDPDIFKGPNANSTMDVVNAGDPMTAGELFTGLDRQVAEYLGLRPEDIADRFHPKIVGFNSTGMSEAALHGFTGSMEELQTFINTYNPSFFVTGNEVNVAVETLQARLADKVGVQYFNDKTKVDFTDQGFTVQAMYGKDAVGGYKTLDEVKAAVTNIGEKVENVEIIAVNPATQEFGVVSVKALRSNEEFKGDFYIRVNVPYKYSSETVADFSTGNFNKQQIFKPMTGVGFMTPAQFTFERSIVLGATRVADMQPTFTGKIKALADGFTKSSRESKVKAIEALEFGNDQGLVFTKKEFMIKYDATPKDFDAYAAGRKYFDAIYGLRNGTLRKGMEAKNYRWVTNESNSFNGVGRSIDTLPSTVKKIWDVDNKRFMEASNLTDQGIVDLQKSGKTIVQLWKAHKNKGGSYNYAIVGRGTKITELPVNVLTHNTGYTPRTYKDPYLIKVTSPTLTDGNPGTVTHTLGTSEGEAAAARWIEAYNKDPRNAGAEATYIRDNVKDINPERDAASAGLWYEGRGKRLNRLTGEGGLTPIVDPIQAIQQTAGSIGKAISHVDWLSNMKQRYIKEYGDRLTIPSQFSAPGSTLGTGTADGRQSKALYDYINMMSNINPDDNAVYKSMVLGTRFILESIGLERAAINVDKAMFDLDPTGAARGLTFATFVAMHPLKQLLQNSATILWTGSVDPIKAAKAVSDSTFLISALATKHLPGAGHDAVMNGLAKSWGVTVNQAKQHMEAFKLSGLWDAVDTHNLYNSSILEHTDQVEALATTAIKAPIRGAKEGARLVKKVGFDLSEKLNVLVHWNFARRAYIAREGISPSAPLSNTAMHTIAADAKILTGNQNKSGVSKMQKIAPMGTQFMQFLVTHTMSLFRDHVATKAMATKGALKTSRNRIAFGLAAYGLFGAATFKPFVDMYEKASGTVLPEYAKEIILFSVVDSVINGFLGSVTGEKSDLAVAEVIAPAVAFSVAYDYITKVGNGEMDLVGAVLGPNKLSASRIGEALSFAEMTRLDGTTTSPEATLLSVERAVEVFRGFDDAAQAWFAYKTGQFQNKRNNPLIEATLPRILGRLFGVRSKEELAYFAMGRDERQLKKGEQAFIKNVTSYIMRVSKDGYTEEVAAKINTITKGAYASWDAQELSDLSDRVATSVYNAMNSVPVKDQLFLNNAAQTHRGNEMFDKLLQDPNIPDSVKTDIQNLRNARGEK